MTWACNRRQALAIGAGAVAAVALAGPVRPALAANNFDELIKKFTGGKTPTQGRVKLDLPEIAENGNTVPMTVSVESPMTRAIARHRRARSSPTAIRAPALRRSTSRRRAGWRKPIRASVSPQRRTSSPSPR